MNADIILSPGGLMYELVRGPNADVRMFEVLLDRLLQVDGYRESIQHSLDTTPLVPFGKLPVPLSFIRVLEERGFVVMGPRNRYNILPRNLSNTLPYYTNRSEKEVYDWLTEELGAIPDSNALDSAIRYNNLDLVKHLVEDLNIVLVPAQYKFIGYSLNNRSHDTIDYLFSTGILSVNRMDTLEIYSIISNINNLDTMIYFVNVLLKHNSDNVIAVSGELYERRHLGFTGYKMDLFVRSLRADIREEVLRKVWNGTGGLLVFIKDAILRNRDEV
jgi:hypothetical protein